MKTQIMHCLRDTTKKGQQALHVYSIANFVASRLSPISYLLLSRDTHNIWADSAQCW